MGLELASKGKMVGTQPECSGGLDDHRRECVFVGPCGAFRQGVAQLGGTL